MYKIIPTLILAITAPSLQSTLTQEIFYTHYEVEQAKIKNEFTNTDTIIYHDSNFEIYLNNFLTHIPVNPSDKKYRILVEVLERGATFVLAGVTEDDRMKVSLEGSNDIIVETTYLDILGARDKEEFHVVRKEFENQG